MSLHFASQLQWRNKSWRSIQKESESDFNEPEIVGDFTTEYFEFEYDAVIDRALRYSREVGVRATETSTDDAEIFFNRYVTPSRTITVVAEDELTKVEALGALYRTLLDIPIRYRFIVDATEAVVIIYPDGTAIRAHESRAGKKWLKALGCKP